MTADGERLHAIVYGRVQGVSFRYYTVLRAKELGLNGWVTNLDDGSVEVLAEGSRHILESFLLFLHTGPSGARVTRVEVSWQEATDEFKDFYVH